MVIVSISDSQLRKAFVKAAVFLPFLIAEELKAKSSVLSQQTNWRVAVCVNIWLNLGFNFQHLHMSVYQRRSEKENILVIEQTPT